MNEVDPYRLPGLKPGEPTVKPDDHSELVPLLPIPNRTVKRLSADDSADSRVKVGHRQAINATSPHRKMGALFSLGYDFKHVGALVEIHGNVRKHSCSGSCCQALSVGLWLAATDFFLSANAAAKKKVERRLTR